LEVGADRPHDIENVCKYINTDIVVMTQFAKVPVHIELFGGDRDKLIREKKYLVESLKTGGTFIFNADDEDCVKIAIDIKKENDSINLKTFSFKNKEADIFVNNTEMIFNKDFKEFAKVEGIKSTLEMHSKTIHINMMGTIGDAIIYSFMPAILVSDALNINIDKAVKNIESSKRTNGRMRILEGIYNTVVIDDSYNASPKAVEHGINTINNINTNSKKIFVLGDMLDLGDFTKSEHERIGELLVNKCDILITSGIRSKFTAKSAIQHGMNGENVYETNNSIEAGKTLIGILDDIVEEEYKSGKTEKDIGGIIIFVKGSQGARMERVTKMILAKNHNPNAVLVRQEKVWEDK
jgi:UDP-N-acetylmuramoyl-tripeptide--D-alanyl-D-alanine ligase